MNKVTVQMESGDKRTFDSKLTIPQIRNANRIGNSYFYYHWNGSIAQPMIGVVSSLTIE